ncbi:hypothetical protein NDU88_010260, partial [Pleurodeles waltl]
MSNRCRGRSTGPWYQILLSVGGNRSQGGLRRRLNGKIRNKTTGEQRAGARPTHQSIPPTA